MKTEEWRKNYAGMTTTAVVEVGGDDTVPVRDEIIEEFRFDRSMGTASVDSFRQRFITLFPYAYVAERLRANGYYRAAE